MEGRGPEAIQAACPAKVNLLLRVLRRRDDGFHELDLVFQAIDLWDTLEVRPSSRLSLTCDDPAVAAGPSNLAFRAAELLRERYGDATRGAAMHLRKRIPVQAGLGGGSSDAAGALTACARLWDLDVDGSALAELGRELGADVPFFLTGGCARGVERGDRIERLEPPGPLAILLGFPPFGLSTAEVFELASRRLTLPGNGVSLGLLSGHKWLEKNDFGLMTNDLEGVVFDRWPELLGFRDALREEGADRALLSGSGSTVYGVFRDLNRIRHAESRLRARFTHWGIKPTKDVRSGIRILAVDGGAGGQTGGPDGHHPDPGFSS